MSEVVDDVKIELIDSWDEFAAKREQWEHLYAQSPNARIFLSFDWLQSWWLAYSSERDPLVLFFRSTTGEVVGGVALYSMLRREQPGNGLQLRCLRFMGTGTGGTSTSLGILTLEGQEVAVANSFTAWLKANIRRWDVVDLHLMEDKFAATSTLVEAMTTQGWDANVREDGHLFTPLPEDYEAYLASLSKKMRTELPYEERRLNKAYEMQILKCESEKDLPWACEQLFDLNTRRWQARGGLGSFHDEEKRVLCREMCDRFFRNGWLDFWLMKLDGQVVAVELGFHQHQIYYPLWVAIDAEFNKYSPGSVLRTHIIRDVIARGMKFYEFMQGSEPYKTRWGTVSEKYLTVRAIRRHGKARFDEFYRQALQKLAKLHARVRGRLGRLFRRAPVDQAAP